MKIKRSLGILIAVSLLSLILCSCGAEKKAEIKNEESASSAAEVKEEVKEDVKVQLPFEPRWKKEPVYDVLNPFNDPDTKVTTAMRDDRWFLVDREGNEVKELSNIYEYMETHFATNPGAEGRVINIYSFSEGVAKVNEYSDYEGGTLGFIDENGDIVIDFTVTAEEMEPGSCNMGTFTGALTEGIIWTAPASTLEWSEDTFRFIDRNKNKLFDIPAGIIKSTNGFHDGLCPQIMEDGSARYLDKKGNIAISLDGTYEDIGQMKNGYAWFADDYGNEGLIDKEGNVVIEPKYSAIGDVNEEGVLVFGDAATGLKGLMNVDGTIVAEAKYADLYTPIDGITYFSLDGEKYGLMDKNENIIVEPQFKFIMCSNGVITALNSDDKWGIIENPLN